jgi:hypothetical protein
VAGQREVEPGDAAGQRAGFGADETAAAQAFHAGREASGREVPQLHDGRAGVLNAADEVERAHRALFEKREDDEVQRVVVDSVVHGFKVRGARPSVSVKN